MSAISDSHVSIQDAPLAAFCERHHIVRLSLFGSVLREVFHEGSDVDVLVEFAQPATLDGYLALKERLEQLLEARVDLVTANGVKPRMKAVIEREAVKVA